jgi:uncharacterized protein YuzE
VSDFLPYAEIEQAVLRVQLVDAGGVRSLDIDCVVDLTDFDEVVGVEILDLRKQLAGGTIGPSVEGSSIRWSYDAEMDALYLHVMDGRGQVQRRSAASGQLDAGGRLVRLDVPLSRAG